MAKLSRRKRKEFEEECGYTIEQLKELGFTETEISEIQAKRFNPQTGEKIDRKKVVEDFINKRRISFQEIGKGTTRDFSSNPEQASKAFEIFETGVRTQEEIKEGQTQGE